MKKLILFFIVNLIFFDASMSWAENAAYCDTTQVLKLTGILWQNQKMSNLD